MKISEQGLEWKEDGHNGMTKWNGIEERFHREVNNILEKKRTRVGMLEV